MKIGQYKEDTLAENQCFSGNIDVFDDVFLPILLLKLAQKKTPPQVRKHCEGEKKSIY